MISSSYKRKTNNIKESKVLDNKKKYIYQFNTNIVINSFILFNKYFLSGYYVPGITEMNKQYI